MKNSSINNKSHLTILIPHLCMGGAEKVTVNLINALVRLNVKIDILLLKQKDLKIIEANDQIVKEFKDKVNVIYMPSTRAIYSISWLFSYMKKKEPTSFLSVLDNMNILTFLVSLLTNNKHKIFLTIHNNISNELRLKKNFKNIIISYFVKYIYKHANKIIAVSNGISDNLVFKYKIPQSCIKIIYNPIITSDLALKAKEDCPHPWLRTSTKPVILAVGSFRPQKDFPTLIKAFSLVRKQIDVRLIILGEGALRKELESMVKTFNIEDSVSLPGFSDNVYSFMSKADLFVLSSKTEALPTVLIEALACNTPIISTDCEYGPREILENGKFGTLVNPGNYIEMANAICNFLEKGKGTIDIDKSKLEKYTDNYAALEYVKTFAIQ